MRVVVDTNVLVSGLLSSSGPPAKIVNAILTGTLIPVMSEATLAELEDVLFRPRLQPLFARAGLNSSLFLADMRKLAHLVKPQGAPDTIRDEADRPFLELMASRPASEFLITETRISNETAIRAFPSFPPRGS